MYEKTSIMNLPVANSTELAVRKAYQQSTSLAKTAGKSA